MSVFFLKLVNMSISASWIVLAVLLLRLLLKSAPRYITVLLWGIVAVRLISPFSVESMLSLIPSTETIAPGIMTERVPAINTGIPVLNNAINPVIGSSLSPKPLTSINPLQILVPIMSIVWAVGFSALLIYMVISYVRLQKKIGTAIRLRDNIYTGENVVSPFVLGIIRPKIYLPSDIAEQDAEHVIAHEQAHIKRKDHLWKPLGFLLLALHWFNPLMWLGYILLCRDIELACDEKVVREFSDKEKADYSEALLACSVNRRIIAACPLAFGEVGVKNRVRSVLNYKKPSFWIILAAVIISIAVAVCFLTDPKSPKIDGISVGNSGSDMSGVKLEIIAADLSSPDPFIKIEWHNGSSEEILFGEEFAVYFDDGETRENCSIIENPVWHLVGYLLEPGVSFEKTYYLNGQIMAENGKYRLEAPFSLNRDNETEYSAWIEFELNRTVDLISSHTFIPTALVYIDGSYSFVPTVDGAPAYMLVNGMQLVTKQDGDVTVLGTLSEAVLDDLRFYSRFLWGLSPECWSESETLSEIASNNKRIWQLYRDTGFLHELYVLLEQNDGTFYLGYGYYNVGSVNPVNPDDSRIRWLYRLEETEGDNGSTSEPTEELTLDKLRVKYPMFFDVSTDGGLTVYIWQMSANSYRCYLANTFLEALSDNSFAYEFGATIEEMRMILASYGISRYDVTLHPIRNPLSSYYYEIDDEYRAKIDELFWQYIKPVYGDQGIPALTVECNGVTVKAAGGTSSLSFDSGNGTVKHLETDSSHPLAMIDHLMANALKIDRPAEGEYPTLKLNFELTPGNVKINSWRLDDNGEYVEAKVNAENFTILPPDNETYLYEIVASWSDASLSGTARYSFIMTYNTPEEGEYDTFGVKMDVLFKSATEFDIVIERSPEIYKNATYTVSPEYSIRAYVENGETVSLADYMYLCGVKDYVEPSISWDDVLYTVKSGGKLVLNEDLKSTYGELPKGSYLLVKTVNENINGTNDHFLIMAQFAVTD